MPVDAYCFARTDNSNSVIAESVKRIPGLDLSQGALTTPELHSVHKFLNGLDHRRLRNTFAIVEISDDDVVPFEAGFPVGAAAALALQFPEVFFLFVANQGSGGPRDGTDGMFSEVPPHHFIRLGGITKWLRSEVWRLPAIFDPWGLRSSLKADFRRVSLACVGDEESAYCLLNGLAAYRAGFRVAVVQSLASLAVIERERGSGGCQLVLADHDLAFFDSPVPDSKALFGRLVALASKEHTYLVTGAEHIGTDAYSVIRKPYAGLYEFLAPDSCPLIAQHYQSWKLDNSNDSKGHTQSRHSGGPLTHIAEALLERSRRAMDSAASVDDLVHAALLALESKELSGHSRTLRLEALAAVARAEVTAECDSLGTTATIQVSPRFDDMEAEVSGTVASDEKARRHFLEKASSQLRSILRTHDQSEAVDECLRRTSKYSDQRHSGWTKWGFRYVDLTTDSGTSAGRLAGVSLVYIIIFAFAYMFLFGWSTIAPPHCVNLTACLGFGFGHSLLTTLELSPGLPEEFVRWQAHGLAWRWTYSGTLALQLSVTILQIGLLVFILQRRLIRSPA